MSITEQTISTWEDIVEQAMAVVEERELPAQYRERLQFELAEISKQGANLYWLRLVMDRKRFSTNPGCLVLPWLMGMVDEDPITMRSSPMLCTTRVAKVREYQQKYGFVPPDLKKDPDMPDIDLDCLPLARDPIKAYAIDKYSVGDDGYGSVCSVGTIQTFKFKSALRAVATATNSCSRSEINALTTALPEEVDDMKDGGVAVCKGKVKDAQTGEERECKAKHTLAKCSRCGSDETETPTIGRLLQDYPDLNAFAKSHPETVDYAVQLVGRSQGMGMHAGALIIADRPLFGNIPMAIGKKGHWVSLWTEGRSTQLSKFGYNKWDILGLKTLQYLYDCCTMIESNRGISFGQNMDGWDDIDPTQNRCGHYFKDGQKHYIPLNDQDALSLANRQETDAVFQFDTDLAKSILANGVRNFEDLMLFNAMGHPGPMASIPDAVKNRDDSRGIWRKRMNEKFLRVLGDTYGVIVYQEQLQTLWQTIAGFTAPEAQEARKAVAKKWREKLAPVRQKWLDGAAKEIGSDDASLWWDKMETFGRYAFNRSHAVSYCLVAYRCLWLKAHFAPEFWASVMSSCHPDKLVRYMGVARAQGVQFDTINMQNLTATFTVTGDVVNQGMVGIKKLGKQTAHKIAGKYAGENIDDFVQVIGKNKIVFERFIKLGAFRRFPGHENAFATWQWYRYSYCSGKDITELRRKVHAALLEKQNWNEQTITAERQRQFAAYRQMYPKRTKMPNNIVNWAPKPEITRKNVIELFPDDFSIAEVLQFEKEYLGYYLHSPLEMYRTKGGGSIEEAKRNALNGKDRIRLEVVILDHSWGMTKTDKPFCRLIVSDGIQSALLLIWDSELRINQDLLTKGDGCLRPATGIQVIVDYDQKRNSFTLKRGEVIIKLQPLTQRPVNAD